jgi:hypothetical protein
MKGTSSIGFDGKLGRHFSLRTTTNSPPRLYEPRVKGLESIALFARNSSVHLVRMPPMLTVVSSTQDRSTTASTLQIKGIAERPREQLNMNEHSTGDKSWSRPPRRRTAL